MSWEFLADNLPHATASLNAIAAVLLVIALLFIQNGRVEAHKRTMIAALAVSGVFLGLYLLHKFALYEVTGEPNKRFPTDPEVAPTAARYTYYGILLTHLVLAIAVPFLALRAAYLGLKGRIDEHRRLVKFAYPIWMYVSITGVLVYVLLYHHQRLFA